MDTKSFSLDMAEPTEAGQQIYNNYAPKGNEECKFYSPGI